ncbi:MAG: hypothetical protein OJF58_001515 [Enhydrobacter sp.]|nr:MAG: hypothetical protein OJF58_001515 [Enhydrobacter sp.]
MLRRVLPTVFAPDQSNYNRTSHVFVVRLIWITERCRR